MKAALVALLLVGCARPDIRDDYSVVIDPSFSVDDQVAIIAGVDDWQAKVPVTLRVSIGWCSAADGQICVQNSNAAGVTRAAGRLVSGCTNPGDGQVLLNTTMIDDHNDMQMVSAHEIGHAMGLVHEGPGNVMSPGPSTSVRLVTCNDIAQWYTVRGRVAP